MKFLNKILFFTILILLSIMLSGCDNEILNFSCMRKDFTQAVSCPKDYIPVCAPDSTQYDNVCLAEADGWNVECVVVGECETK